MSGDAELRIVVNPEGMDADIGVRFLARCFGTQWTGTMYRWYLQRSFGGETPDRLILMDGERVVAGCGLAYRLLRTPDGTVHPVSVVVAAGTVPGERGRGCYARVLQAAVDRSALRGCTAVLGFVTADNATGRGLRRRGATVIASALHRAWSVRYRTIASSTSCSAVSTVLRYASAACARCTLASRTPPTSAPPSNIGSETLGPNE